MISKFLLILSIFLLSSCSEVLTMQGTIYRDCTGVYIRKGNVDYLVCNEMKIKPRMKAPAFEVTYKLVEQCRDTAWRCVIYHPNAGSIVVKKIKPVQ